MNLSGQSLQEMLLKTFPQSHPKLQEFPSGAFMIDLLLCNEVYVVEYLAGGTQLGLSRQKTAVFGWEGAEKVLDGLDALEDRIREITKNCA